MTRYVLNDYLCMRDFASRFQWFRHIYIHNRYSKEQCCFVGIYLSFLMSTFFWWVVIKNYLAHFWTMGTHVSWQNQGAISLNMASHKEKHIWQKQLHDNLLILEISCYNQSVTFGKYRCIYLNIYYTCNSLFF